MSDANVHLRIVPLGARKKERDTDPEVVRLVEEWRQARRAGERMRARNLAGKVEDARQRAQRR